MKILFRHLFNLMLQPLFFLLLAFSLLFIIADLMDMGEDFYRYRTSAKTIATYYSWQLPSMIVIIIPICLLLATLYSLSQLTRHSEITAMRASGIGIHSLMQPYLWIAFSCLLATSLINEWMSPRYSYRAHELLQQEHDTDIRPQLENIPYRNPTVGHTWFIEKMDTRGYTLQGVTLRQQRSDGTDAKKITAKKAYWLDQRWWFEEGTLQAFNERNNLLGPAESFQILEMRSLPEIPEDFLGESKDTAHLSAIELNAYIQTHQFLSTETLAGYNVDLHHKLATPFSCLLAVLLGIPVGAHTGRRGALVGTLLAITLFFGYYGTQFLTEYLARTQWIEPWIGCWSPTLLFILIGSLLIRRMR